MSPFRIAAKNNINGAKARKINYLHCPGLKTGVMENLFNTGLFSHLDIFSEVDSIIKLLCLRLLTYTS